jgi:hypothetical protein
MQAGGQAKLPRLSMLPDRTGRGSAAVGGDDIAPNLRDLADRRIPVAVCHHDGDQGSIALEALGRRTSGLQSEGLHRSGPPAILPSEGGRQRTRPGRDPVERGACRARAASAGRVTRIAGGRRMGEPQSSRTTRFSGGMPTSEEGKLSRAGVRDRGRGTDQAVLRLHVLDSQSGEAASQAQDSKIPSPERAPAALLPAGGNSPAQPGRRPTSGASAKQPSHSSQRSDSDAAASGQRLSCARSGLNGPAGQEQAAEASHKNSGGWTAVGGGANSPPPPAPGIKSGLRGNGPERS